MLEQKIAELTKAVEALTSAMTSARPSEPASAPQTGPADATDANAAAPAVETPKADGPVSPNAQDLKDATLKAARAGHKDAIRTKLEGFGVTKIQDLNNTDGAAFYAWVTTLGSE